MNKLRGSSYIWGMKNTPALKEEPLSFSNKLGPTTWLQLYTHGPWSHFFLNNDKQRFIDHLLAVISVGDEVCFLEAKVGGWVVLPVSGPPPPSPSVKLRLPITSDHFSTEMPPKIPRSFYEEYIWHLEYDIQYLLNTRPCVCSTWTICIVFCLQLLVIYSYVFCNTPCFTGKGTNSCNHL